MSPRILVLGTLVVTLTLPFAKAGAQERIVDVRLRSMLNTLDAPMDCKDFLNPMTFKEFIGLMHDQLLAGGKNFPILVDTATFTAEDPDRFADPESVYNVQIRPLVPPELKNIKLSVAMMLRMALAQVPERHATYLVRRDHILITTASGTNPERLTAPPARFEKKPLAEALEEIAEASGATIIVDNRAGDKAKTPITAAFRGTTTAVAAVQLLAESADLTGIVVDNVLFVTTREHAQRLRAELTKKAS
jgi:hypothetical protein